MGSFEQIKMFQLVKEKMRYQNARFLRNCVIPDILNKLAESCFKKQKDVEKL